MSTFYLQGCKTEPTATEYFDNIYVPVQELIDYDTDIQEDLFKILIIEEDLDSSNVDLIKEEDIVALNTKINKFKKNIDYKLEALQNIKVYKNEKNLKQLYRKLLTSYSRELYNNWPKLWTVLNKKEISEEEIEHFNDILREIQNNLDKSLNEFYAAAEDYAERYNIEIEIID
jgi:hypothetical protein